MYKISEISKICGVSIRTLHYYDEIGLLNPCFVDQNSYRYYDEDSLKTIQLILLFKELDFSLAQIKQILYSNIDINEILDKQIILLKKKKDRLKNIIKIAEKIRFGGLMDSNDYQKLAKEKWGNTAAYKEFEERGKKNTIDKDMLELFKDADSDSFPDKLKKYITDNYYTCTDKILENLAEMYTTDEFKKNIDAYAGIGSAKNASKSINKYLNSKKPKS